MIRLSGDKSAWESGGFYRIKKSSREKAAFFAANVVAANVMDIRSFATLNKERAAVEHRATHDEIVERERAVVITALFPPKK